MWRGGRTGCDTHSKLVDVVPGKLRPCLRHDTGWTDTGCVSGCVERNGRQVAVGGEGVQCQNHVLVCARAVGCTLRLLKSSPSLQQTVVSGFCDLLWEPFADWQEREVICPRGHRNEAPLRWCATSKCETLLSGAEKIHKFKNHNSEKHKRKSPQFQTRCFLSCVWKS